MTDQQLQTAMAVIAVGEGRGFVVTAPVAHGHDRVVVTAAHCLPRLPPAASIAEQQERTYRDLLSLLDQPARNVWAECLFVDPVADIAVLGPPDRQALPSEAEGFVALLEHGDALAVGEAEDGAPAWLLTLDGRWARCQFTTMPGGPLWIMGLSEPIVGGMSGSPILVDSGEAAGLVVTGHGMGALDGPHPRLTCHLPGWLLHY